MSKTKLKLVEFGFVAAAVIGGVLAITAWRFADGSYSQQEASVTMFRLGVPIFAMGFFGVLGVRAAAWMSTK